MATSRSLLTLAKRVIERLATVMALAGGFVVGLMVLITADALGRKLVKPVPGALEFSEAAMVAAVFLPLMYVQMRREHVFVSVVTQGLPVRVQALLDAVAALVGVALFGLMTWLACDKAWEAWTIGEYRVAVIPVPIWPFRWLIPLGTGLLCLQLVLTTLQELRRAVRPRLPEEAAPRVTTPSP
ncbi:MAG TPA: TRAP transporter small permease [Alphaproteobacteria bacterium]|nr:TRAP transporter small permease [Alphaproteobacteria bacterium]